MLQRALILAAFCLCLHAQPPACTANVPNPPIVHSEGLNELLGDIVITCTFPTPTTLNINLILNTSITGRTMGPNNMSETVLFVNNPGTPGGPPVVQATTNPYQQSGSVTGSTPAPNVFQGVQTSPNVVAFNDVAVPIAASGGSDGFVLDIEDVRADVSRLLGFGLPSEPLIAELEITTTNRIAAVAMVTIRDIELATVQRGLNVSVAQTASYPITGTGATLTTPAILRFSEGFPGAFQSPASNLPAGVQSLLPPVSPLTIVAGVLGIPAAVSISAPTTITSQDGSSQLTLVTGNTTPSPLGPGYVRVPALNNEAFLVYGESKGPPPARPQEFHVPIFPSFAPGTSPTTLGVQGFLAAAGTYPQYVEPGGGPYDAIQIVNPASPTTSLSLNSNVGKTNCFAGQPFMGVFNTCFSGGPSSAFSFSIFSNASSGMATVSVSSAAGLVHPVLSSVPGYDTGLSEFDLPVAGSVTLDTSSPGSSAGAAPAAATTDTITLHVSVPGAGTINQSTPVTILAPTTPVILPQGFTDVADFRGGFVSPGQIFSLFPQTYGQPSAYVAGNVDASGNLSTTVANTQVLFDGKAAPLLGVTPTQINGVAPFELTGKATTQVTLVYQGVSSPAIPLPVQPASISIISASGFGGGPCACLNQDGSYNTQANPAHIGDVITMIVNYGGPMDVPGTDGRSTIAPPYNKPQGPVTASIGGVAVTDLLYAGNLAGFVESAEQWNLRIPPGVLPGLNMIQIGAGGATNAPFASIWIGQ